MRLHLETDPEHIRPHLRGIAAAADREKEALGFWPESFYEQACEQRKILLAVATENGVSRYAGHMLFGGTYPHARIFQTLVVDEFRKHQIGSRLLEKLISILESQCYLSVKAQVASNLVAANAFYERHQFLEFSRKDGGVSRSRKIIIRIRDLATPSLLSLFSSFDPSRDILFKSYPSGKPVYSIDLNVLFDLLRTRERTKFAENIMSACLSQDITLCVTDEFKKELERNRREDRDPILSLAMQFPTLPSLDPEKIAERVEFLKGIVFPDQHRDGSLSAQDISDLKHIAISTLSDVSGFITSENSILSCRSELLRHFRFDVIGAEEFSSWLDEPGDQESALHHAAQELAFRHEGINAAVRTFLTETLVSPEYVSELFLVGIGQKSPTIVTALEGQNIVGCAAWRHPTTVHNIAELIVVVDGGPAAPTIAEYLIEYAVRSLCASRPVVIRLSDVPGQSIVRNQALAQGFVLTKGEVRKLAIGRVVLEGGWHQLGDDFLRLGGLSLERDCPQFSTSNPEVAMKADKRALSLAFQEFETMFGPMLYVPNDRPAVVVPIQAQYAEHLLGGPQGFLLPKPEASLLRERTYFCGTGARQRLLPGSAIVFYESGAGQGRKAAIAVARVQRSAVCEKSNIPDEIARAGVIDKFTSAKLVVKDKILAVNFDNIFMFKNPISLSKLKGLGLQPTANGITSYTISPDMFRAILNLGEAHV